MNDSTMSWDFYGTYSFDLISKGLIIGVIAGISEGFLIKFVMDFFGLTGPVPIFG